MLLSVDNLHVRYGAITALRGVCLHVGEHEIVALIGSNGAGKSTLLRTISGLLRPAAGTILHHGARRLDQMLPHQIVAGGVSHVPEGRQIFPDLSVEENLVVGAHHRRRHEVASGLDHVYGHFPELAGRRRQRGGTLSGGEQQMLAIGRALMARPELLLLDEPSLGLAPKVVQRIYRIIRQINGEGVTILLVEQNAHMALGVANRGYVLQTGQIVLEDTATSLLASPEVRRAYLGEASAGG